MKFPVCDVCLKSGILCNACKSRMEKGEFKESHMDLFKMMNSMMPKSVGDARIKKVMEAYDLVIFVTDRESVPSIVRNGGPVLKNISKEIDKPVRVIADAGNYREFLENVLFPVSVIAVNIVYAPEKEILKVIIPERSSLPVPEESLNEIMKREYGKEIIVARG